MIDCRKNIYSLTATEWNNFATAVNMLKSSGEYEDFVKRHYVVRLAAHRGPAFFPWHRYFIREFELALQSKVPGVTLPYWNWPDDLGANPAAPLDPTQGKIWNTNPANQIYMGGDGDPADSNKVNTGPFAGWTIHESPLSSTLPPNSTTRPMQDVLDDLDAIFTPIDSIRRFLGSGSVAGNVPFFPTQAQIDDAIANYDTFDTAPWNTSSANSFRNRIEGWDSEPGESGEQLHNRGHTWIDGSMSPPSSPNDPVFFLHHCNIDRIWAAWQRAHPNAAYLPAAGGPAGHNLNDLMTFLRTPGATPAGSLSYARDMGFMYDTDLPFPELETPVVTFNDVPEGIQTARAVVYGILDGCRDKNLSFEIVGAVPAPFTAPFGTTATYNPATSADDKVRIFLAYQGTTAGAVHNAVITVRCIELDTTDTITINANTISKPSVACALVLDRSGSMLADAGLGNGKRRIDVLQDAAPTLVDLLDDQDGIAIASFNEDSSPDMPMAVAGPPPALPGVGPRGQAKTAIANLSPGGATSIGDGIVEGLGLIASGPAGFDTTAVVVFTDGHENSSVFLTDIAGQIDSRVFALGLGRPDVLQPARLQDIANGTDGYMMLTGDTAVDALGLQKFFVQILSGVDNSEIVLDPDGRLLPGNTMDLPFVLHGRDTAADVIVLAPQGVVFDTNLTSPTGFTMDPQLVAGGLPGVRLIDGTGVFAYRMQLPVINPLGSGHAGRWVLSLSLSDEAFKKYLAKLETDPRELRLARSAGVPFVMIVRAKSSLRLRVRSKLDSREPGGTVFVSAMLSELDLPFRGKARAFMEIQGPGRFRDLITMKQSGPGRWSGEIQTHDQGAYRVRLRMEGVAADGRRFTRERLLTASVWEGGDREPFGGGKPPIPDEEKKQLDLVRDPGRLRPTFPRAADPTDLTRFKLSETLKARLFDEIMASDLLSRSEGE